MTGHAKAQHLHAAHVLPTCGAWDGEGQIMVSGLGFPVNVPPILPRLHEMRAVIGHAEARHKHRLSVELDV